MYMYIYTYNIYVYIYTYTYIFPLFSNCVGVVLSAYVDLFAGFAAVGCVSDSFVWM